MVTTQPACSFRLQAEHPWGTCSFRLQAEKILLIALIALAGCAPHRPVDDLTLSTQVKIELLQDPTLGAARLDVSTLNGVVTLSGTVPSQTDADRAIAAARHVHGVHGVKSDVKIGG